MKRLLLIALAAGLAFGCAQFKLLQPGVAGEDPVVLMTGYFGGKGNLSVTSKDGTTVKITQDGASEGLVSMFTGLISSAAGVFGGNPEPPEITINVEADGRTVRHADD